MKVQPLTTNHQAHVTPIPLIEIENSLHTSCISRICNQHTSIRSKFTRNDNLKWNSLFSLLSSDPNVIQELTKNLSLPLFRFVSNHRLIYATPRDTTRAPSKSPLDEKKKKEILRSIERHNYAIQPCVYHRRHEPT